MSSLYELYINTNITNRRFPVKKYKGIIKGNSRGAKVWKDMKEGSGMGKSESDIRRLCPKTEVRKGLKLHGASVGQAKPQIEKWLKEVK